MQKGIEELKKGWLWKFVPFIGFLCTSLIYVYKLKKLNKFLRNHFPEETSFSLLANNNSQHIKYFGIALLLIVVSLGLGYLYVKWIRYGAHQIIEIVICCFCLLGLLVLDVVIIGQINIPILRVILGVCILGGIFSGAVYSNRRIIIE